MSFEELKKTFTISYGMALSILMVLFVGFQHWNAVQNSINNGEILEQRMDKRHKRQTRINDDVEKRIRELELNNEKE